MKNIEVSGLKFTELDLSNANCVIYNANKVIFIEDQKLYIYDAVKTDCEQHLLTDINDEIIGLYYLEQDNSVVIVTTEEVVLFNLQDRQMTVKKIKEKIVASSIKPCESILLLINRNSDILQFFLSNNLAVWEPFCKSSLDKEVDESVYVGWGSRETQFKGQVADVFYGNDQPTVKCTYTHPTISWRGNGEYFVINFWKYSRRFLRVYSADCDEIWESQVVNGLKDPVCFKNEGNIIATVVKRNDTTRIFTFEKNCLPRDEFRISHVKGTIKRILFHHTLPILVIHTSDKTTDYLDFYTNSNGKWYLKQELYYEESSFISFQWGPSSFNNLFDINVITRKGVQHITFKVTTSTHDLMGVCGVVDGYHVNLYHYRKKIVPPPVDTNEIGFNHAINRIEFHPTAPLALIQDANMNFYIYSFLNMDPKKTYEKIFDTSEKHLLDFEVTWKNETPIIWFHNVPALELPNDQEIVFATTKAHLYKPDVVRKKLVTIKDEVLEFTLTASNELYFYDSLIKKNVGSFFIYKEYIVLTTSDNNPRLYCVELNNQFIRSEGHVEYTDSRRIEQGSYIVCIANETAHVLLQMPRGNLELISFKTLSIAKLKELLSNESWTSAFSYIRSQRLSWNILIDLYPDEFLLHMGEFIAYCDNPSVLTQVCTDLNVITINPRKDVAEFFNKKIHVINQILTYLEEYGSVVFLPALVSVIYKYFTLGRALKYLLIYVRRGILDHSVLKFCEQAVNQLRLYCSTTEIFSEACLCYDIDFLKLIVKCCNFNPLEYEPKINSLCLVNESERRFEMAAWGGHHAIAVGYLLRLDKYDEDFVCKFIKKYNTYEEAYIACPSYSKLFPKISVMYGTSLGHEGRHKEAGLVLHRGKAIENAFEQFKIGMNWREMLVIFKQMDLSDAEKQAVMEKMAEKLFESGEIESAIDILAVYLDKKEKAATILVNKQHFKRAQQLILIHKMDEFYNDVYIPAIDKYLENFTVKVDNLYEDFKSSYDRLLEVRDERKRKIESRLEETGSTDFVDDIYSETETTSSRSRRSNSSTSSSRGRRKEEKKKTDLKRGGKYEDIALIRQLHIIVTKCLSTRTEFMELCLLNNTDLWYKKCLELHTFMEPIMLDILNSIDEIWCKDLKPDHTDQTSAHHLSVVENLDKLDEPFRTPPILVEDRTVWKLAVLKK